MVSECVYWVEIVSEEIHITLSYKLVQAQYQQAYEHTNVFFRIFFSQRITFDKIWESRAEHLLQNNYDNNSYRKSEFLRIQNFSEFFHVLKD